MMKYQVSDGQFLRLRMSIAMIVIVILFSLEIQKNIFFNITREYLIYKKFVYIEKTLRSNLQLVE
jgi:hypothetical protein